jgi:thiol-disulfide isomerase/thioredoxin
MASSKYVNFNQSLSIGGDSSSIFSRITNISSSLNSTTLLIIGTVILFSIIAYLYYVYYVAPQMKAKYQPNSEITDNDSPNGNTAELLFFYADWCPHCKTAKPIWNELKTEYENKTINGYKVIFTEVNCSEETAEVDKLMNQFNVEGYPTIKLLKDGQIIEYDAKPSKDTLVQFLNTVL